MTYETIDWLDHFGNTDPGFRSKAEILESLSLETADFIIRSHGEVLYEDDTRVLLAAETRLDEDLKIPIYRHYTIIYKALIKDRKCWE